MSLRKQDASCAQSDSLVTTEVQCLWKIDSFESKFVLRLLNHLEKFQLVVAAKEADASLRRLNSTELYSVIQGFLKKEKARR